MVYTGKMYSVKKTENTWITYYTVTINSEELQKVYTIINTLILTHAVSI